MSPSGKYILLFPFHRYRTEGLRYLPNVTQLERAGIRTGTVQHPVQGSVHFSTLTSSGVAALSSFLGCTSSCLGGHTKSDWCTPAHLQRHGFHHPSPRHLTEACHSHTHVNPAQPQPFKLKAGLLRGLFRRGAAVDQGGLEAERL